MQNECECDGNIFLHCNLKKVKKNKNKTLFNSNCRPAVLWEYVKCTVH